MLSNTPCHLSSPARRIGPWTYLAQLLYKKLALEKYSNASEYASGFLDKTALTVLQSSAISFFEYYIKQRSH